MLRIVEDETPALSDEQLYEHGNKLASDARMAAVEAVRRSSHAEFLERGGSLTVVELKRWRERAKTAREAWAKVEALTDELIREVEKNRQAWRDSHELITVPDPSGKPGHYVAKWVDRPAPATREGGTDECSNGGRL